MAKRTQPDLSDSSDKAPAPKQQCLQFEIPESISQWKKQAESLRVQNTSINQMETLQSGSRVVNEQHLSFRVVWPTCKSIKKIQIPNQAKAREILKKMAGFKNFLDHIADRNDDSPRHTLGTFQLVREAQIQAGNWMPPQPKEAQGQSQIFMSQPTPTGTRQRSMSAASHPSAVAASIASLESLGSNNDYHNQLWERTNDGQIVNEALLLFLRAFTINTLGSRCSWSSERLAFKIKYHRAEMESRRDGYLGLCGHDKNKEAFVILEAKGQGRTRKGAGMSVYKQESAEMVNWIMHDEKTPRQVPLGKRSESPGPVLKQFDLRSLLAFRGGVLFYSTRGTVYMPREGPCPSSPKCTKSEF
ncbi:hypothetical protein ASPVEDRAFT_33809 [Aspergillus versicolor CBS 583.65]|uniref:Uncharacterized protein n=1 Tax=Aspergillus versicolor CBS 583.65 TaxID=1036611 RepID=A0A1L9Q1E6_ASPVE|nr:uncharacterized protein ASPVEDRAFT_33809 [Aspergillus versicolor CBS 583.65]OJJ07604.1 hypothetical protein ASPVEDRAFT_33809 [Aspergillus versicolor CBS 583.65]